MPENNDLLVRNIEIFIRKYYKTKLYQGLLAAFLLLSTLFLIVNFVEYFAFLPGSIRKWVFYGFLLVLVFVVLGYVLFPLWKLISYRKQMKVTEAAKIIGDFFSDSINDKLLNTLQLQDTLRTSATDNGLLLAAIRQRTESLLVIPFSKAVDRKWLKKLGKASLLPLSIFILILLLSPQTLQQPSKRILDFSTEYTKPLPYRVTIGEAEPSVMQNEDYTLQFRVDGTEIPSQFFIETGEWRYVVNKLNNNSFQYVFKKVMTDIVFAISGGDYQSNRITLRVKPKALLLHYEAFFDFPDYTGRQDEKMEDFVFSSVPAGTRVSWSFFTRNADSLHLTIDSLKQTLATNSGTVNYQNTLYQSASIKLAGSNQYHRDSTGIQVLVEVVADAYPQIKVEKLNQETFSKWHYFTGFISDDYGFSALKASIVNDKDEVLKSWPLDIERGNIQQNFYFTLPADSLEVFGAETWEIRFAVSDNDAVFGAKTTQSNGFELIRYTQEKLDSLARNTDERLDEQMKEALKAASDLKNEVEDFSKKLRAKKEADWNDKQKLSRLLERQKTLDQTIQDIKNNRNELNQFRKDNELMNEQMLEKQQRIDQLLEEVIPDDIRKMMEDLQKMLDNLNKDQMADILKEMEMSQKEMEDMLDRNLSLLEQLQVEKDMNALIERLSKLSEQLSENADKTLEGNQSKEAMLDELNKLEQAFENEVNQLDSLTVKNQKLEQPFNLENTDKMQEEIRNEMEEASGEMKQGKKKQSASKQKSASEKMKSLANQLEMMMMESEQEQMEEDATLLRFLLENLLRISAQQERLFTDLSTLKRDDPRLTDLMKEQAGISENFRTIDDSLVAMSKRQPLIENFVFDETGNVKRRIGEARQAMLDRNNGMAVTAQQYAMMAINNLALMLSESLKNMQESMGMPNSAQGQGRGKGKSKNKQPGQSLQNMREMQEALGKQLKEAMQGKPGQGKKGGMSEELARMAAQQEALRNELKKMIDQMKSEGQVGEGGLGKVLEQMEQFEEGLVNKQLNQKMVQLNEDIVTRLLESEKAQKEREFEERRNAEEFRGKNSGNLMPIPEYNKMLQKNSEELKVRPLELKPYYRRLSNSYFLRTKEYGIDKQ